MGNKLLDYFVLTVVFFLIPLFLISGILCFIGNICHGK